ncbi:MAG: putative crotonobetaine/carnitine-CoA ligase [Solirubrobacterales bacterium]|nr:putative crotonobetaine/carnitine-CoA ligase [Solirubrobacterales bacterium]
MSAGETFEHCWRAAVAVHGDRPFLVFDDLQAGGATWSYAAFDRVVDEVAGRLSAAGAGPHAGGAVHVVQTNGPAFVACWLAAMRIGAPLVPSDPRSTDRELAEHARRTVPAVAVLGPESAAAYAAAFPGVEVIAVEALDVDLAALRGQPLGRAPAHVPAHADHAATMFTSGTTSAPKGVILTQAGYAFAGRTMADAAQVTADDRCLVVLPLFHANAQYYSCAAAIVRGACVVLLARFSASQFVELAVRHRATHASLFAAPMRMILARTRVSQRARLRHCWFAQSVTAAQYEEISVLLGCRPRQLYGMTETLPAVITTPVGRGRPDTMGAVTPGCTVQLLDPDSREVVRPGAVGEIAVGGRRGYELFAGYLHDAATTEAAFVGDHFLTGDLGRVESDGSMRFVGRRGDVLKVAGENVSTVEVEAVLAEHPLVEDVAVVGVPDPIRDEVPIAHVVGDASAAALAEWCAARLAPSKRPREFVFHDVLPRTSVGKIRKFKLGSGAV